MDPQDAYQITQMLQGVVNYGTARAIRDCGRHGSGRGKDGDDEQRRRRLVRRIHADAGRRNLVRLRHAAADRATNASGGRLAAPAWAEIYKAGWREPKGRRSRYRSEWCQAMVDPQTGELATEWCPSRAKQWFKPGSDPQESVTCTRVHRRARSRSTRMAMSRARVATIRSARWGAASAASCGRSFTGRATGAGAGHRAQSRRSRASHRLDTVAGSPPYVNDVFASSARDE